MRFSPRQSLKLLKSQKAGMLIGYLLLIMGVGFLTYSVKVMLDERGARNWVPHVAQIENARLETHVNDEGRKSYTIEVAYKFDWEGTSFAGKRYRLHDDSTLNFEELNPVVEALLLTKQDDGRYPIFVNPKNPQQSAIKNIVHPKAKSKNLFLGFLFSILGYFTAFKPKIFRRKPK